MKRLLMFTLVTTMMALGLAGCKGKSEPEQSETEQPATEHPATEHPASEHPE